MKTIVVSGGTDGIGKALAHTYLSRGERVAVVGRNLEKGKAFLAAAAETGAAARAFFIPADLSLVAENHRVVAELEARFPVVDALVLCARHYRSARLETSEGLENTFALEYVSRYLLGHGLIASLERAERPVVVNVSGPGIPKGEIHWDDPGLAGGYSGGAAQTQAGRANDLLGVAFAAAHGAGPVKYVLVHPGAVATSFSGRYDAAAAAHVAAMKRTARPVAEAVVPIAACIDDPPAEPLSAFVRGERISVHHPSFDHTSATRLLDLTRDLLAHVPGGGGELPEVVG
ncbi:SDR family NAD(P)-dependent oxidoreductase [Streptomyces sp. SID3343]|uniref:SDR family NAD(P)-dependent oxidoreductase n=1 Tax=Streptomyces sp. SID3343 TaxID=2690260 RepID=UPI00136AF0D7|nr:SDR family NAD(P)-dependent oxidoreductase [Streptomyces sp. SID3343]